jgi:hypothetical protein
MISRRPLARGIAVELTLPHFDPAHAATDPTNKALLLEMAQSWIRFAEQLKTKGKSPRDRPPGHGYWPDSDRSGGLVLTVAGFNFLRALSRSQL